MTAASYGAEADQGESILRSPEPASATQSLGGASMVRHGTVSPGIVFSPGARADGVGSSW